MCRHTHSHTIIFRNARGRTGERRKERWRVYVYERTSSFQSIVYPIGKRRPMKQNHNNSNSHKKNNEREYHSAVATLDGCKRNASCDWPLAITRRSRKMCKEQEPALKIRYTSAVHIGCLHGQNVFFHFHNDVFNDFLCDKYWMDASARAYMCVSVYVRVSVSVLSARVLSVVFCTNSLL